MNRQTPGENQSKDPNARLRAAAKSVEVPAFLEAKIRGLIRTDPPKAKATWSLLLGGAAVTGVAFTLLLAYEVTGLRKTAQEHESFIAAVSGKVSTLMQVGLGDHIHCAFYRKFPAQAPAKEEIQSELDHEYRDLIPVVRAHVPSQYKLMLGHECRYHGRLFVHFALRDDAALLSLVITEKEDGDVFDAADVLPRVVQSSRPIYAASADRFQIAAMETPKYLVYFVSDLPDQENREILLAMAPELRIVLEKL